MSEQLENEMKIALIGQEQEPRVIRFNPKQYNVLLSVLKAVSKTCVDVIVSNGVIRNYDSHRKVFIEVDLSQYIGSNGWLAFPNASNKYKQLKTLAKTKRTIEFIITDEKYIVRDVADSTVNISNSMSESQIRYLSVPEKYLMCLPVNKSVYDPETTYKGNRIVEMQLEKIHIDRIKACRRHFGLDKVFIRFTKGKAEMVFISRNRRRKKRDTMTRIRLTDTNPVYDGLVIDYPVQCFIYSNEETYFEIRDVDNMNVKHVLKTITTIKDTPIITWAIGEY
ncbi:MAG TPA: hypothetical protein PKH33_04315 [bacterium]|nr:hypothetical protein [bacterium]